MTDRERCEALDRSRLVRAAVAATIPNELPQLARLDWRMRVYELSLFTSVVIGGMALTASGSSHANLVVTGLGIVVTAVGLNAFVLLMHEGMHGLLFERPGVNGIVSVMLGATFLMSFSAYRVMHIRHHEYLGDPRDPDDYYNYTHRRHVVWCLHLMRLTLGPLLYLLLIPCLAMRFGSLRSRVRIAGEYLALAAAYAIVWRMVPAQALLVGWLIPLVIVGALTAVRGFAQHGITDSRDPYLASRTLLPHPAIAFALLHENHHLEHHLFPEVPSYHLPRLHQLVWRRLPRAVSGRGYLRFLVEFLRAAPRMDETPIGLVRPSDGSS